VIATAPRHPRLAAYLGLVAFLSVVAFFASRLRLPDTFFYTGTEEHTIVPHCAEIHCFRVLIPWTVSALPGPSLVKWKGYGVLCNAAAAIAVFDLCLVFGLTRRASVIAGAITVLGFGSFYTLFEPYTSDPLMFWLTPLETRLTLADRMAAAAAIACVGVFAKEFVVVPFAIVGLADARHGRWSKVGREVGAAAIACAVWLGLQLFLRWNYDYSFGTNKSPRILAGSYLAIWLSHMSPRGALSAMFNQFGATYLLIPVGWLAAPPKLRQLVVAALPIALFFSYVQQPDRALWNFHFLTSPLAALVLEPMSNAFVAVFLAVYAFADLKVGAQMSFVPQARYAFAIDLVLAVIAVVFFVRATRERRAAAEAEPS